MRRYYNSNPLCSASCDSFLFIQVIGFGDPSSSTSLSQTPSQRHTMTDDEERDMLLCQVESNDLVSFGLIPEFTGRLPVVVGLNSVTEQMLLEILTQPQNCLVSQYTTLFAMDGVCYLVIAIYRHLHLLSQVKLMFSQDALRAISRLALKKKTGARGLRAIMVHTQSH